jgi:hypothetical protein
MKKEIIFPVILIILGLIFCVINMLVYFTKGNHHIIRRKIKVGALIISLTGILACGTSPTQKTTCYSDSVSTNKKDGFNQDSIKNAEKQRQTDDSITNVKEKQQKKDSLAKKNHKKKPPVAKPVCYRQTCYTPRIKNVSK